MRNASAPKQRMELRINYPIAAMLIEESDKLDRPVSWVVNEILGKYFADQARDKLAEVPQKAMAAQ